MIGTVDSFDCVLLSERVSPVVVVVVVVALPTAFSPPTTNPILHGKRLKDKAKSPLGNFFSYPNLHSVIKGHYLSIVVVAVIIVEYYTGYIGQLQQSTGEVVD